MSKKYSVKKLNELAGGDHEFMAILAKAFLKEIPPDVKAMEEAILNDNRELAYQFAHKMKPNFEMFGLNLNKDITAIETWSKSLKNKTSIEDNLDNVLKTVNIVLVELKEDYNL